MDYDWMDKHNIGSTWIEGEVYELFKSIIIQKRDDFFEMTVDFELSQQIRDDARRRGQFLNKFLTSLDNAWSHIDYSKDVVDRIED